MRFLLLVPWLVLGGCGGASTAGPTQPQVVPSASTSTPAAVTYPIRISRDEHVGDRAQITYDAEVEDRFTLDGKPDSTSKHVTYHLEATQTGEEVNAEGKTTRLALVVDVLRMTVVGGATTTLAARGQAIEIVRTEHSDDATVTLDRAPASKELRAALDDTVGITVRPGRSEAVWGTTERKAVGDEWPVQSEAAKAFVADDLKATSATGTAKVIGTTTVRGEPCLVIEGTLQLKGRPLGLGAGIHPKPALFSFRVRSQYPTDLTKPSLGDDVDIAMKIEATIDTPNGKVTLDGNSTRHVRSQITPLRNP